MSMSHFDSATATCIDACLVCHKTCFGMVMTHCLETGGDHLAPAHVRMMMACAELCRAAASLMLAKSGHAAQLCKVCADVCFACAEDCAQLEGMEDCVTACRTCAEACHAMSEAHP